MTTLKSVGLSVFLAVVISTPMSVVMTRQAQDTFPGKVNIRDTGSKALCVGANANLNPSACTGEVNAGAIIGTSFSGPGSVPANLIAFTDAGSCPTGWSEFTSARGRYIVGLPSGGTNLATVGTALSNSENRAVGQHNHTVTDPGHVHGVTDPGHVHAGYNLGGDVSVKSPGGGSDWGFGNLGTTEPNVVRSATTGISVNSATTSVTVDNNGSVSGTNAPYIQLMACKKS